VLDIGKQEYEANCVVCHGAKGKGDGPFNEFLKVRTPDLTVLSKNNGGLFPVNRVLEVIDGRTNQVKGHGTREMPIWGDVYNARRRRSSTTIRTMPRYLSGLAHLALIDYLNRLQVK
jgi:mono/diheme cytochrome c family protein